MTRVARVTVAVRSIEDALAFYRDALGGSVMAELVVAERNLRIARIDVGGIEIELLQPTEPSGPVSRFLDQHGEGLHHLTLEADDLELEIRTLLARGTEMIDRIPREGPDGKVAFVNPRSTGGVLIELKEAERTPPVNEPLPPGDPGSTTT